MTQLECCNVWMKFKARTSKEFPTQPKSLVGGFGKMVISLPNHRAGLCHKDKRDEEFLALSHWELDVTRNHNMFSS